jgi:hypothetical protein
MHSLCVVELHVTVNYIKVICISQQCHYGKFMSPSTFKRSFDVSLTVHLSIILANDQLDAQIFNTFITILYMYMFLAISCSSSGGQIVLIQHLVSSLSVSDRPVCRLRVLSQPVH